MGLFSFFPGGVPTALRCDANAFFFFFSTTCFFIDRHASPSSCSSSSCTSFSYCKSTCEAAMDGRKEGRKKICTFFKFYKQHFATPLGEEGGSFAAVTRVRLFSFSPFFCMPFFPLCISPPHLSPLPSSFITLSISEPLPLFGSPAPPSPLSLPLSSSPPPIPPSLFPLLLTPASPLKEEREGGAVAGAFPPPFFLGQVPIPDKRHKKAPKKDVKKICCRQT